ncbi:MAG: phosphogluconate dehydrogenase (NAD(+)-dependent, decarboxylating) [Chloroflexota bacterium]
MELGLIGLGKMGGNMARRVMRAGHQVVVFDRETSAIQTLAAEGAIPVERPEQLVDRLTTPRTIWVMLPAGTATDSMVAALSSLLSYGDTIVDGSNSYYKDSMRRASAAAERGIDVLDAGVSGGVWGLESGYCLMVGGNRDAYERIEPLFQSLAPSPDNGYVYVGQAGAGHYVKMVHNAIEYGMMEAYTEGFELLQHKTEFDLNLTEIAHTWQYGSVVRSWLLELATRALEDDPGLSRIESYVPDSGEGRWAVTEAVEQAIPAPVITLALQQRFRSRQEAPFAGKMLAALREQFGGHTVRRHNPDAH